MNRSLSIVLALLFVGSAGFGFVQLNDLRQLKQNVAALDRERADLQKRIWDLKKRNGELENRLRPPTASAEPSVESLTAGEFLGGRDPAADETRDRGRPEIGRFATILANPEVQKLMAVQQKAGLDGHYASLFKQLNLSPDDLEKFKNLLVEKQAAVMDVMAAARAEGLNGRESRDQIRQLVQQAQGEVDTAIRTTLGEAAYGQYQNYEATVPQRNVVDQLGQRLSYSTQPLTDTQSNQLVQILAATAPPSNNAGRSNAGSAIAQVFMGGGRGGSASVLTGGGSPITNDAITQAQSVLSAQQLSAMQALQQEQQSAAQLRQQMRAGFGGQASGAPTPGPNTPKSAGPGDPGK